MERPHTVNLILRFSQMNEDEMATLPQAGSPLVFVVPDRSVAARRIARLPRPCKEVDPSRKRDGSSGGSHPRGMQAFSFQGQTLHLLPTRRAPDSASR